jgi:hypothetical protein
MLYLSVVVLEKDTQCDAFQRSVSITDCTCCHHVEDAQVQEEPWIRITSPGPRRKTDTDTHESFNLSFASLVLLFASDNDGNGHWIQPFAPFLRQHTD